MSEFLNKYNLKNLVKQKPYYKNPEKLSCIDLILTNYQRNFQDTCAFETGLSDFQNMTITVMKLLLLKQKPKIKCYGD